MRRYYTGIGSRNIPKEVEKLFMDIGSQLADNGYILRSGHAEGSDLVFETGCELALGDSEIYIPWNCFNGSCSQLIVWNEKAFDIAKKYHPNWNLLSDSVKRLMARNSHQILGEDLDTLSEFVICWTKEGKGQGGTGQALRIAKDYNVPVYDCGGYKIEDFKQLLNDKLGLRL